MSKQRAYIYDWAIIYLGIPFLLDNPAPAYAPLHSQEPVALYGRVRQDPRCNPRTGQFTNGHRIITTTIVRRYPDRISTNNTVYTLGAMSRQYAEWCKKHGQ